MFHSLSNKGGFTLTELLVAMALSGVVMASIGYMYYTQQKSYLAQEQLAAAQQNLRSAMYFMERDIRMAGCDPTEKSNAGIGTAGANTIAFTSDLNGDTDTGDTNESVSYSLADNDGDGDNDLLRNGNLIAENIDALDFVYLDINSNPTGVMNDIRTVQVSVVAKTGRADPGYTDTRIYTNQRGQTILGAQNDRFRRKQLDATIKLRNTNQ
jgi:type IV pilus assembly protein PilW